MRRLFARAGLAALLLSSFVQAQEETIADALFREARASMRAGDFASACPKLEESYRIDPSAGTLVNLAVCLEKSGALATAATRYQLAVDTIPATDERAALARNALAALTPRVPRLRVVLAQAMPAGARVTLDGVELRDASLGSWLPVNPGKHVVGVATSSGTQQVTVALVEAQRLEHVVTAPSAEPKREAEAPAPSPPGWRRPVGWSLLGIGAAGLVTSAVFGGLALGKKSVVRDHCTDQRCDADGLDAGVAGARDVKIANIAFLVGALSAAGGGFLLLTTPGSPPAVAYAGTFR